jgi:hypothetical protein
MAVFFLDFESGNDANDGTTFANRWKTITSGATAVRIAPGDVIRIMATPDPTSLGINATWTDNNDTITLASAVTQTIDNCEGTWTASTNVTFSSSTTSYRQGTNSVQLAIAAAFTTGLAGYGALSNLNLSAYQQIALWIKPSIAVAANVLQIKLCSDAAGATALDTLNIPALSNSGEWYPIVINKGSALSSGINSIALYAASDPGTITVNLDNIIACKAPSNADALTLRSMIGKNTGSEPEWWPIASIDGTTIKLQGTRDSGINALTSMKYQGVTETVVTYKRESITVTSDQTINDSGNLTSGPIEYSFGWDRTSMSTLSGETWLSRDAQANGVAIIFASNRSILKLSGSLGAHNSYYAIRIDSGEAFVIDGFACSGVYAGIYTGSSSVHAIRVINWRYCIATQHGFYASPTYASRNVRIQGKRLIGPGNGGTSVAAIHVFSGCHNFDFDFEEIVGWGWAVYTEAAIVLRNATMRRNNVDLQQGLGYCPDVRCFNVDAQGIVSVSGECRIVFNRYAKTADDHRVLIASAGSGQSIVTATDQRHTASDFAWKFVLNAYSETSEWSPNELPIAKVAVKASALVTAKLWVRRDDTAVNMRLFLPGGQIAGVASDVYTDASGSINTWEQLTISFTPTQAGVVELFCHMFGDYLSNERYGWCDDFSVTQA